MHAYAETYLMDAMECLGGMAEYASTAYELVLGEFWSLFAATSLAREFETGSPRVIAGMSGIELALHVGDELGLPTPSDQRSVVAFSPSPAYWAGFSLAYYQWRSCRSFADIDSFLPIDDVLRMYPTFHEESEERFAEAAEEMAVRRRGSTSKLRMLREAAGLSQSELARKSGVGLRAIQQYEQGAKDINRAAAGSVQALARTLHCQMEDLLEPRPSIEYACMTLE